MTVYYPVFAAGNKILRPGQRFKVEGTATDRIDFLSLMLALFLGTAALPAHPHPLLHRPQPGGGPEIDHRGHRRDRLLLHPDPVHGPGRDDQRRSSTCSTTTCRRPLLARSFGTFLFSMISAIAFATVLGTVSGLIIAASGAVAHDLLDRFGKVIKNDKQKVNAGKIVAFAVGALAIVLGIIFKGVNVTFLVGLAFAVAASANLPSIVMMLFWKRTTARGITASIFVGVISSIGLILFSPTMYELYGKDPLTAPVPPEESRHRLHPAELPDARRRLAAHPAKGQGRGGRRPSDRTKKRAVPGRGLAVRDGPFVLVCPYIPYLAMISCLVLPRMSNFFPTLVKASSALSRWCVSWPAEIWVRMRAWLWGTTGKKKPMA